MDRTQSTESTAPSVAGEEFAAFEETIVCPGCNRPIALLIQPIHTRLDIHCPRCLRSLNHIIRAAIRQASRPESRADD
ncbi:MAG: hypothetical protein KDK27_03070 [Leptospiraceae bacterium]|nr:hypothetical protein [Leptospiraceae bacterium]